MLRIIRTGVYAIAIQNRKLLLIQQHKGLYKDVWDLPGGAIEFGEKPEQALQRELLEETHMEFEELRFLDHFTTLHQVPKPNEPREPYEFHRLGLIYAVVGVREAKALPAHAAMTYRWWDLKELSGVPITSFVEYALERGYFG